MNFPKLPPHILLSLLLAATLAGCGMSESARKGEPGPPSLGLIPAAQRRDGPPLSILPSDPRQLKQTLTDMPPLVAATEMPPTANILPMPKLKHSHKVATEYFQRAEQLLAQKKLQPAIDELDGAIEHDPNFAAAYTRRAYAYNWLRMYEKAVKDCDRAIELDANLNEAYRHRASAHLGLGMVKRSIDDSTKAIELNPRDYDAYWVRADACINLQDYKQAVEDFTTALNFVPATVHPVHEELLQCRAEAYKKLGRGDLALKDLREAKN